MDLFHPKTGEIKDDLIKSFTHEKLQIIWESAEALTSSESNERRLGFSHLIEFDVIRQSPLIAYLIATKINEPDLVLRAYVVKVLADVIAPANSSRPIGENVRLSIINYFSQMDINDTLALLELADTDSDSEESVKVLFCVSSCAGSLLMNIALDREKPISIRQQAVKFIGEVGYLEALPVMERLEKRIKSRTASQDSESENEKILRLIEEVIKQLKAP